MSDLFDRVAAKVGLDAGTSMLAPVLAPVLAPARAPVWGRSLGLAGADAAAADDHGVPEAGPEWRSPAWADQAQGDVVKTTTLLSVERESGAAVVPVTEGRASDVGGAPPPPEALVPKVTDAPRVLNNVPEGPRERPERAPLDAPSRFDEKTQRNAPRPDRVDPLIPASVTEPVSRNRDVERLGAAQKAVEPPVLKSQPREPMSAAQSPNVAAAAPKAPLRPTISIGEIRVVAPPPPPVAAPQPAPVVVQQAAPPAAAPAGQALKAYLGWRR